MLRLLLISLCTLTAVSAEATSLLQGSTLKLQIPESVSTSDGVVALISSTPSFFSDPATEFSYNDDGFLSCPGATLTTPSPAVATCARIADVLVLDGITRHDRLAHTRHGTTLTQIFRACQKPTTLVLLVESEDVEVEAPLRALYAAASADEGAPAFDELYTVQVVVVESPAQAQEALAQAKATAARSAQGSQSLASALSESYAHARSLTTTSSDPPQLAQAQAAVAHCFAKHTQSVRATLARWKARAQRGLLVDDFGAQATSLRARTLSQFASETSAAAGLVTDRHAKWTQLQTLLDTELEILFGQLVLNLEKATLKRFNAQLLKTVHDPVESIMDSNAALLRTETFKVESVLDELEVPVLGLTKDKIARELTSKLNDALLAFPDSPAAKIKRSQKVQKTVSKNKKPGQSGVDVGLDLVAMLRPDGFGSLQGYAGYQLGGNSLTFGVCNDADDPQVIAQFGGVRPPLLRVQPKLRVDVEL